MEYFDRIQEALSELLNGQELTLDSSFSELGLDSVDLVDLVFQLEEELDIQFADEELMTIKTVKNLCDLIDSKK